MKKTNENCANYLSVLDYETGKVIQYKICGQGWNPDYESCEDFLTNNGHKLSNIEWMEHDDNRVWTDYEDQKEKE